MLYQLGNVQFEIWPLNMQEVDRGTEATFAEKPVVGRRPPLEFVGEGPEVYSLRAVLFPERLGGLSTLDTLQSQKQSGRAYPFMRGDGRALGHFVIERVHERSTYIGADGVGRVIEVDIEIKRDDGNSGSGFSLASIFSLFG
jgi:phage tail protein